MQPASSEERLLRIAFLAGAITDAAALLPMLIPRLAAWVWGFRDLPGSYRFAMGYGASLMFGWTVLLLWAYRRPVERRFVAAGDGVGCRRHKTPSHAATKRRSTGRR